MSPPSFFKIIRKNDPYLCMQKRAGRFTAWTISAEPYACNPRTPKAHTSLWGIPTLTTVLVENALPKVALLSLANQTSQMLLLVFLDDCHSLLLVSSDTGSTRKRPQIPSKAWSVSIPSTGIINKKDRYKTCLFCLWPVRESNPCYSRERAVS